MTSRPRARDEARGEVERLLVAGRLDHDVEALPSDAPRRRAERARAEPSRRRENARTRAPAPTRAGRAAARGTRRRRRDASPAAIRGARERRSSRSRAPRRGTGRRRAPAAARRRAPPGATSYSANAVVARASATAPARPRRPTPHALVAGRAGLERVVEPRPALPDGQARGADAAALDADEHLARPGLGTVRVDRRDPARRRRRRPPHRVDAPRLSSHRPQPLRHAGLAVGEPAYSALDAVRGADCGRQPVAARKRRRVGDVPALVAGALGREATRGALAVELRDQLEQLEQADRVRRRRRRC